MYVMAAGMHDTIHLRSIRHILLILDGQRIKVSTQGDGAARLPTHELSNNSTAADFRPDIKSQLPEERCHFLRCLHFMVGKFWIHIEVSSERDHFRIEVFQSFEKNFLQIYHLLCMLSNNHIIQNIALR